MKKYDSYKDSGIEWIGEIPEGWDLPKLKWIVSLKSGSSLTSEAIQEEGLYKVYGGNGFRGFYKEYTNDGFYALIGRQGALCGNINYARGKFWATEHAVVCYPKQVVETIWLGEMLRAMNLNQYSLSAAQPGLAVERISELRIPYPPFSEQQAIATYLDHKVGQIDASISAITDQIADLKAYRQSVISEAVTKGLNPDAKMKDSGIEWIGEIPEGWKCLPLKRGLTICNGKDYKDIQSETGYPVIGSGGQFAYASDYLYNGEAVLLGRKGTIDKPMYINGKFWTVDTMFYAVPQKDICCKYMFYQAQTIPFGLYSTNTALPSMTQSDLADNPMCFPPLSEQQAIATNLDQKTTEIDTAIKALEDQVADLNALKQSVISEAVTGKIDVRDWTPNC